MHIDLAFIEHVNELLEEHPASITRLISTTARNKSVGGALNSGHLYGKAVDLVFDSPEEFRAAARFAYQLGFQGIEADLTNNHLHVDDMPRVWRVVHRGPGNDTPLDHWLTQEV